MKEAILIQKLNRLERHAAHMEKMLARVRVIRLLEAVQVADSEREREPAIADGSEA